MSTIQSAPIRVLVVDDEPSCRSGLSALLRDEGYEVQTAADGFKALGRLEQWTPDIAITDVRMPGLGGIELLARLREQSRGISVIVMTGYRTVEGAIEAMRLGADDYLSKPLEFSQVLAVLQRVVARRQLAAEADRVREEVQSTAPPTTEDVIGKNKTFRELLDLARQVAAAPASVLVTGERGTGKQRLARMIHPWSRRTGALVSVCCSTTDSAALERELFGDQGKLFAANGGTLLLTDIDAMSLDLQGKLLRFLQERGLTRSDGTRVELDVRIVATTSHDLQADAKAGRFRDDLFYRLNVVSLRLPPLRERREDTSLLATYFVKRHARRLGRPITGCTERVLDALFHFDWPGNIRQLENCIERAVIVARGPEIEPRDLPREMTAPVSSETVTPSIPGASLREIERYAILQTLEHTGGSTSKAAKVLGISARKIQYRLCEYGIGGAQSAAERRAPAGTGPTS